MFKARARAPPEPPARAPPARAPVAWSDVVDASASAVDALVLPGDSASNLADTASHLAQQEPQEALPKYRTGGRQGFGGRFKDQTHRELYFSVHL